MSALPNILFIVADDLNAWVGALGANPDVRTPNIDRLAARGTLFSRAYCPAPYCNASRMGMLTGCLPATTGIYQNEPFWERPGRRQTFVESWRAQGYHTFGAGKVFHGVFDYAEAGATASRSAAWREFANRAEVWDGFAPNTTEPLPPHRPLNRFFDFSDFSKVPPPYHLFDWGPLPDEDEAAMPDRRVVRAIRDFLHAPPAQPFFCAAGLYKPHLPWHVPKRFFDLYDPARITLPVVRDDDLDDVPPIARRWALTPADHALVRKHGQWREAVQGYLACISFCDEMVGELLQALQDSGRAGDTAIVFCGDNGFHLGQKLHWRKFVLWEEATRVPLIIVPPGETRGQVVDAPVSLVDIYPTIAQLCGLPVPEGIDGHSLVPLMRSAASERPVPPVMTWLRGNHSVRDARWRYTRYSDGTEELYDRIADPLEWDNLAASPGLAGVKAEFSRLLPVEG